MHAAGCTRPRRDPLMGSAVQRCCLLHVSVPVFILLLVISDELPQFMGIGRADADLVLDFGSVVGVAPAILTQMERAALTGLQNLAAWRSLTVAAGSFPPDLSQLNQGQWNRLRRIAWRAWRAVVTGTHLPRLSSFADYAVGDPALPYTGIANFAANLRYSAGDEFFVWRGHSVSHHQQGYAQMFAICANLVAQPEYAGAAFSQGDAEIQQRAATVGSPGNPELWRRWATNHYLELVVSQVASLP